MNYSNLLKFQGLSGMTSLYNNIVNTGDRKESANVVNTLLTKKWRPVFMEENGMNKIGNFGHGTKYPF